MGGGESPQFATKTYAGETIAEDDPFVRSLIDALPETVRTSLSTEQLSAIAEAASAAARGRRHAIDVRIGLPLWFARYYVVCLVGRDRRNRTRATDLERRRQGRHVASGATLGITGMIFLLFLLVVAFFALYGIKSALGIDLIPGFHLWELPALITSWHGDCCDALHTV